MTSSRTRPITTNPAHAPCVCGPTVRYACGHCWHDTCLDCGQCAAVGCICWCDLDLTPTPTPAAGPVFWLGAHHARWLATAGVPLCVSRRTLAIIRTLPRAAEEWVCDSGAFTQLSLTGTWDDVPVRQYVAEIGRFAAEIGRLTWAGPQDWMCEPQILAKTGLTVAEHQARTVGNLLDLRAATPPNVHVIPTLQGSTLTEYEQCIALYQRHGIDLTAEPLVGVGSICRRPAAEATTILTHLATLGLRLHGYGLALRAVAPTANVIASADSLAWSRDARYAPPLPGHTHAHCNNCLTWAMRWRERVMRAATGPRQLALEAP